MRPHYQDIHEGCINGCDSTICEILGVNISRPSPSSSNTHSSNRNVTSSQNRGKFVFIHMLALIIDFTY
jgi:hypothetical protein